ncbi:hypothetical protein JT318_gp66 [Pseudomonas phage PspYZU01]|uniref:Uncharacterized protein n=1 Tax=Pseudomonas phage PspYZU01 TaxID=1983555 RepID=A0A2U7NEY3_9CAUD|nr:hypothetical protein JT318_gp66 [Pseudomonas phage PspYZU01]ASD51951.1 hypothetical protein PspYZU01_66 [Pseudomonas phage PspYZU01]
MTKPAKSTKAKNMAHRPDKDEALKLMSTLPSPTEVIGKLWPIIRDNKLPVEQHIPVRQSMAHLRHLELFLSNTVLRKREERLLEAEKGACAQNEWRCHAARDALARLEATRAKDCWYRTECIQCKELFFSAYEWQHHYTEYNTCMPVAAFPDMGMVKTAHGFWILHTDAANVLEPRERNSVDDVAMTHFQQRAYGLAGEELEALEAELNAAGAGKLPTTLPKDGIVWPAGVKPATELAASLDELDDLLGDDLEDLI